MKKLTLKYLPANSKRGFSLLAGVNRDVIPGHVTKLAESIEEIGVIRPVVVAEIDFITGKKETYIVDGQHLYNACGRLEIEIPYSYIEVGNKYDLVKRLALLNTSSKSWMMKDFILAWTSVEPDYIELNKFYTKYDIELVQLAEILMHGTCTHEAGGRGKASKMIKTGKFRLGDVKKATILLKYITDMLKIVPRMDRSSNKLLISSYVTFINSLNDYDHKEYLKKLKKNKDKFILATQDPAKFKGLLKKLLTM